MPSVSVFRAPVSLALPAAILLLLVVACGARSQAPEPQDADAATDAATEPEVTRPTITATNAFYYYTDVDAAWHFYTEVLGFETVADYGFAKILQVASSSYLTLVDAERGMHSADEPKTVTLALVTDELEGWWDYLQGAGVSMRSAFEPTEGRPHQGFVAVDPEGYLLEFERFEAHPENERLLPALQELQPVFTAAGVSTGRPANLGIRATVLWLYYSDTEGANDFYTTLLAHGPIVDQGWAWAYQVTPSGFLGIVDGNRGLHQATMDKGVTVSLFVDRVDAWFDLLRLNPDFEFRSDEIGDESGRVRVFVGYDPEGYFLEWDTFLDVEGNETLLRRLGAPGGP